MTRYKAKHYFMIETEHITVEVNRNSKWEYVGYGNNYIKLYRNGVFIDIPEESLERNFVELRE